MSIFSLKLIQILFLCISLSSCVQVPTLTQKFLGMFSSESEKKLDLCKDLNHHLKNLKIDASKYSGKDEEFQNDQDSIGVELKDGKGNKIPIVWTKLEEISKKHNQEFTIFGKDIVASDIQQGYLSDCYFLTAISGFANNGPEFIRKIFDKQTDEEKEKGIITTNWQINGHPTKVSVDTFVPTRTNKNLIFAQINNDFEFWPVILEKAWAKIYGSYGAIEYGYSDTVYRALSMAPVFHYSHDQISLEELWSKLNAHLGKKMPISASSQSQKIHNLVASHAYNPLETCEYSLTNGSLIQLVKVQNPWAQEVYQGPFRDNDPEWTEEMRQQCGSTVNDDGVFFIPIEEYQKAFCETAGAMIIPGYNSTTVVSESLESTFKEREDAYEILIDSEISSEPIWAQIHFIDPRFNRQLPEECKIKDDYFSLWIISENFEVVEKVYDDSDPSYFQKELQGQSKYYVFIKSQIKSQLLHDYTVDVYAPVSYTHLTLPTKRIVQISVVAVSLKKKRQENKNCALHNGHRADRPKTTG
eukprot:TRINITY_DN14721_c0_g1_i1.p1 TRINITY_DN14721_c0_g1~~TRINITY_DN14721_c0_g1_i1.p1  ORF type:complete len:528 (+),score=81.70 TRINITY_DN14721_c0_g1_i1:96-1679(+)